MLSLEDTDSIKLEANLESKTEPLEPISESVPCELFTADSDIKEEMVDEEAKEAGDKTDMGVPAHVEEAAVDVEVNEKSDDSQEITIKIDNEEDNVNLVPEPVADDLPDNGQQYDDEPPSQEDNVDTTAKDDTVAMDENEPEQQQEQSTNSSATIDPSYAPEKEELLYEGDVENDNMEYREGTPVMDEATKETTAETTAEENREQDLSLVLDLHVNAEMEDLQAKEDDQTATKGDEGASQSDKRLVT